MNDRESPFLSIRLFGPQAQKRAWTQLYTIELVITTEPPTVHNETNKQTQGCWTSNYNIHLATQHCVFILDLKQRGWIDAHDTS